VLIDERAVVALREGMASGTLENRWMAVEDYGAHPENLNVLLAKLPSAEGDMTIYLCKALARLKDPRAVAPLLEKWKRAPLGAPGTRYIPDVLAAIGDRSVVPQLIAPLKRCRYDYRFHIAHALGVLGGPEAVQTLKDLAANDPFPAVRELAAEALRDARP
jgi:HEAT repeat protein